MAPVLLTAPVARKARMPPVEPSQAAAVRLAPTGTLTVVYCGTTTTCALSATPETYPCCRGAATEREPLPTVLTTASSHAPAPPPWLWWSSTIWPAVKPVVEPKRRRLVPTVAVSVVRTVLIVVTPTAVSAPSTPVPRPVTRQA